MFNVTLVTYTKSHTYRVSKNIKAPIEFAYKWCTDYRESDPKITGLTSKRKILLKTKHRAIYTSDYKSAGKQKSAVNVVTFYPPKAWHLDFTGDEDDETGDYALKRVGPRKCRLDMIFTEHYKVEHAPTKAQDIEHTHEVWDKYVAALERDYERRS
jgi:hypothetical protein